MAGTITYNDYENILRFYFYDVSTGTFTTRDKTTGDYFTDDCAVGDCLYFPSTNSATYSAQTFRNLKLYIGTAFASDSVTFIWEYASGSSSWTELPDLVDNTSDFSLTGERTVEWTVPTNWRYTGSPRPAQNYPFWIRCRITAISNPTEGGAQSTQAVQVGNNAIVIKDFEVGDPCTFEDIYQEDVSNGWGVVTKLGTFYNIDCNFRIYDYFADSAVAVAVNGTMEFKNESNATFGENPSGYVTKNGVFYRATFPTNKILYHVFAAWGATVNIFSSLFQADNAQRCGFAGDSYKIYNSQFDNFTAVQLRSASNTDIFNLVMTNCSYIEGNVGAGSVIAEDIKMLDCGYVIYSIPSFGYESTIREIYTEDTNLMRVWSPNIYHLVDCTLGNRIVYWTGSEGVVLPHRIYLEYTLAMTVQDKNGDVIVGATVTITDANGDAITGSPFTTDANGEIDAGDLVQYEIKHKVGSGTGSGASYTDETLYTPHTVTISKTGYKTKVVKYDMDRKREEVETLEKTVPIYHEPIEGKMFVNTKPTDSQNNLIIEVS